MRHAARLSLLLLLAAGCGGSSTAPGGNNNNSGGNNPPPQNNPGTTSNTITVSNNYFDPTSTTVSLNTTVKWTWNSCTGDGYGGQTCAAHNILFDDGMASGSLSDGTWSRTFTTAGTYKYHCSVHGSAMSGTIVVQ
jgi:plastocyanin